MVVYFFCSHDFRLLDVQVQTSVMLLSRNEANAHGSTQSAVGMYCLIKSQQLCKTSMLSPNFTFIKRSLWKLLAAK